MKGKCFYINLDKSISRRGSIENIVNNLKIESKRFSAIDYSPGTVGCLLSHHKCMETILEEDPQYDWFLILEDDAILNSKYTFEDVNLLFNKVDKYLEDTPLIMLGAHVNAQKKHNNIPKRHPIYKDFLIGNGTCNTTHAYIVSRKYAKVLKEAWDNQIEICLETVKSLKQNLKPPISLITDCSADHTPWAQLQKRDKWFVLKDMFVQNGLLDETRTVRDRLFLNQIK